ncbi:hypothetical protein BD289DRAFT_124229 [Coniella lustricola]|uniref:Uncharacterized protein n=1 Tax=Coniella lustricola TaxID=2025994 RepID=A0A2T3AFX9_9PEZI|nr:hypothetical protein BD289DRAFT_124229 [Coniella lustricola]
MAPPSTPLKPRFLPTKRQVPPLSQNKTSTPLPTGTGGPNPQFASTPRFNTSLVTTSAKNQPPVFSAPANVGARPRQTPGATQHEPVTEAIDSSPNSASSSQDTSSSQEQQQHGHHQEQLHDFLFQTQSASRSSVEDADSRPAKRQRVSLCSQSQPHSQIQPDSSPSDDITDASAQQLDQAPNFTIEDTNRTPQRTHPAISEPPSPLQAAPRHPTFLEAPRFKATTTAPGALDKTPLPDAFSPQRRGAKYVPGGLASQVRDWLVQVKGASEYDRPVGTTLQLTVSECVQCHGGIRVAKAVVQADCTMTDQQQHDEQQHIERVILAGDGRISGLNTERHSIHPGATVSMHQPMWDVDLGSLGHYAVACDWEVGD